MTMFESDWKHITKSTKQIVSFQLAEMAYFVCLVRCASSISICCFQFALHININILNGLKMSALLAEPFCVCFERTYERKYNFSIKKQKRNNSNNWARKKNKIVTFYRMWWHTPHASNSHKRNERMYEQVK